MAKSIPQSAAFADEADLIRFCRFASHRKKSRRYILRNIVISIFSPRVIPSGVLVAFCHQEELEDYAIVLTWRSAKLKAHSNQMSFPGGRQEKTDEDLIATALRETQEEIGIAKKNIRPLGVLNALKTPTGYLIQPTLALLEAKPNPQAINTTEVEEVYLIPTSLLLDPSNYQVSQTKRPMLHFLPFNILQIFYKGRPIWGATAEILYDLASAYYAYRKKYPLERDFKKSLVN